ncbi:MAG: beta-Ala-His dipeptidase [Lachnospiraceae bacterium]|nr:beta-Ala-His dipeptidase [Lachnospiraceae bacterium]
MLEEKYEKYSFWEYFEEITKIPRGSGHTEAIADYLIAFAKDNELRYLKEDSGNVIIYAPGSEGRENERPLILQGHMDMVAVKDEDCDKDMLKDGLDITVEDGFVTAVGTTLGADDGIAIAYILAVLSGEVSHPPIEALFTRDEEIGMLGAAELDTFNIHGRRLINLDNEDDGILTCGCAGGCIVRSTTPVEWKERNANVYEIKVSGLKGGHSGVEINENRLSAATIVGRFLAQLKPVRTRLMDVSFGDKDNAIANTGYMKFICSAPKPDVVEMVEFYADVMKNEFATREPGLTFEFNILGEMVPVNALHKADSERIMDMILALPQGVESMSADVPGLVETSCNVGICRLTEEGLKTTVLVRSSVEPAKQALADKVAAVVALAGGTSEQTDDYPGWDYIKHSELRDSAVAVYKEMFGKKLKVDVIHAGLECGMFIEKMPQLDCIAFGPEILNAHTTKECLNIESAEKNYDFLVGILAKI